MKKIYAVSQKRFVEILEQYKISNENVTKQNTAFIQIGNTDLLESERYEFALEDTDNVIGLRFDDCDEVVEAKIIGSDNYVGQYPMSKEQAKELFEFIEKNKEKETFLVHCRAGQSRSGGIIKFLSEYFQVPYDKLKRDNPNIYPNSRIVSLLREEFYDVEIKKR